MNRPGAIHSAPLPHLTQTRLRELRLLCAGSTLHEIAGELAVSPETIRRRFYELRLMFGARTNAQLAAIAIQAGLTAVN